MMKILVVLSVLLFVNTLQKMNKHQTHLTTRLKEMSYLANQINKMQSTLHSIKQRIQHQITKNKDINQQISLNGPNSLQKNNPNKKQDDTMVYVSQSDVEYGQQQQKIVTSSTDPSISSKIEFNPSQTYQQSDKHTDISQSNIQQQQVNRLQKQIDDVEKKEQIQNQQLLIQSQNGNQQPQLQIAPAGVQTTTVSEKTPLYEITISNNENKTKK